MFKINESGKKIIASTLPVPVQMPLIDLHQDLLLYGRPKPDPTQM